MPLIVRVLGGIPYLHHPDPITKKEVMILKSPERIQLRNAALCWDGYVLTEEERRAASKMLIDWYIDHDVPFSDLYRPES